MTSSRTEPTALTTRARRVLRRVVRGLRLPPRELLTTLHAALITAVVEALIRWVPLPRLCRLLGVDLDLTPRAVPADQLPIGSLPPSTQRQLRSTARVLDVWPLGKGPCLRRSLVAGHMLRRHEPAIRIGIAGTGGDIHAHAWLEIDGHPLEAVGAFSAFEHTSVGTR